MHFIRKNMFVVYGGGHKSHVICGLLSSSEDILDRKLNGNIYFFVECWPLKTLVFMKTRNAEKIIVIFALVFIGMLFTIL